MKHHIALLTCVLSVCFIDSASAQRPRHGIPIQVDYEQPARTWEEAAASSHITAIVRLTGRRYVSGPVVTGGSAPPLPTTVYQAEVLEVVRNTGPQQVGPVIEIRRAGGVINKPDGPVTIDEAGFPMWSVGTRLLLFLSWNEQGAILTTAGGPNAAFEVDPEGKVRTFGKSPLAAKQNRRSFDEFLKEIKEKVR